jgi:NAD(P)-dependent dehydrogenase (short-subunit alcohol dehydrogenase family)
MCMMNIDLTGRSAIVTGASRGIGLAVTRALVGSSAHVIAGAQPSSAELDKLATEGTVTILNVALGTPGGPAELAALAGDSIGILVNNVGADIRIDGGLIPTW